jgi:hypothetical protein
VQHSKQPCPTTKLVGFAFVDDTDLITSGPNMSVDEVDIIEFLNKCIEDGEHVVLGIDINEDVRF